MRAGACARAGAVSEELRALQPASFAALIQGNGFTLWHYRTGDTRAVVVASGYFAPVAASLRPGDLMILQAADALALLPVRSGPAIGTGVTLDGAVGALSLVRSAAQRFSFAQTAQAVVRTLVLGPVAASMVAGSAFAVSATVTGPVSQVVFTVVDSDGVVVPTPKTVVGRQRPRGHELPGAGDRHAVTASMPKTRRTPTWRPCPAPSASDPTSSSC